MRFEDLDVWKRAARRRPACDRREPAGKPRPSMLDLGPGPWALSPGPFNTSNIAEGYERATARDRVKFLNYAKGSSGELRTQIYIGMEAGYIDRETGRAWIQETREISKMLYALMKRWGKSAKR